jgi:anti-sigma regulatory factor (Ser/Thr protein kinase)
MKDRSMGQSRRFDADPASVSQARSFVREALTGLDRDLVDDGILLVSEVAANVVEHARTSYEVNITVDADRVRVDVCDRSAIVPATSTVAVDAERGRGLVLVQSLATSWGVEERDDGKCVWFELDAGRSR